MPANDPPQQKPTGDDSFSLFFRFWNRFEYMVLHVIGPPRLSESMDPRARLQREYERRRELHEQWQASR
ncbi:hypothetical protein [Brevibacterium album]|uniref:hypothetical protein n=1 Tax=Brevibacterium album TaxID=417948 RepID=UPI0003FE6EF4|nr:hypothetical protein [Brevibacterium album]